MNMLEVQVTNSVRRTFERITAKAPVYARDIRDNPRWILMFILGRFVRMRQFHTWLRAAPEAPVHLDGEASEVIHLATNAATILEELADSGLSTGFNLTPEAVQAIRTFATTKPCYASFDYGKPLLYSDHTGAEQRYNCTILVGHFLETVASCPTCVAITQDRFLWDIARAHFGFTPTLVASRLWWSFASERKTEADISFAAQSFHYDLDDWNQLKFFFYLSDVGDGDGPHKFIAGSHRRKPIRFQFSPFVGRSEAEIFATYGSDALMTMTGAPGFGFVEDSFGYHVGAPIERGPRLLFEISFGATGVMKRRPFGTL